MVNQSTLSEFLLLEFSDVRELQILHFVLFLVLYFAILTGNLLIIFAVAFDHHLHTPMYFFLMNLAIQDLGQVSVILPKSMANSLMDSRHISYSGCMVQVLLFVLFLTSDFCLLTVMAYDRYVAICNPLHYEMVITGQACAEMIAGVWIAGFLYAGMYTGGTFAIHFCSNIVNQFFCEIPQLLKLSCSNLYLNERGALLVGSVVGLGCFVFVLVTYTQIFITVFRIPSVQGRKKAFSTCLPHLIVFSTLVITGSIAYLGPTSNTPSHLNLIFTMIYSITPPLLNPIIYSMKNKEIKSALCKLLCLKMSSKNIFFNFHCKFGF
ncbi:olfactory receptor 14A16-like [Eublepharis macularius]|uniref:Olfactory receptor n=1 Tax=Eublepharis macularius TaxID=481883 RepID=A0AA97LBS9_EUBMA|nr:olfactory receptor 14A16-like [Eublepharis macularius]